jgi:GntR family transcriptional regulator
MKKIVKIDFRSHNPINIQILEQLRRQIAAGDIAPGQQLPTLREMAADLRINFTTVARAYQALDAEGLISTQHGRGTFVLGPIMKEGNIKLREKSLDDLTRDYVRESGQLGFDEQTILETVQKYLAVLGERTNQKRD